MDNTNNNSGFNHSIKVPQLYKCASKILEKVTEGAGSIRQLVFEKKHFNIKALHALVGTAFKKSTELELLLKRTKLLENESRFNPWLAKILITELIWGKKQLPNIEAKPILIISAYEQAFKAHLSDSSDQNITDKKASNKPRYVRVNTLKSTMEDALNNLLDEGWQLLPKEKSYDDFLKQVSQLEGDNFIKDYHIDELLIFPSGTEFHYHPGYKKGILVLQDKASCLPVHLLAPLPGSTVLDMCAAPGMKTTQLAAVMKNEGTIYAVERDSPRYEVLTKLVDNADASCVTTLNRDILDCGHSDYPNVDYILVDPSCSGSGIPERIEENQFKDPKRLQKLAGFQIKILRSALTRYPHVKRIIYSTCSLYSEENEDVVRQVLESNANFKLVSAKDRLKKEWNSFGSSDFGDIGAYCLYSRPEKDLTNGFFVAIFERLESGESNQFYNTKVLSYIKCIENKRKRKERKLMKLRGNSDETNNEETEKVADNNAIENSADSENINNINPKKEKKKKRKDVAEVDNNEETEKDAVNNVEELKAIENSVDSENINNNSKKEKKKKRKDIEVDNNNEEETIEVVEKVKKKKKKSKDAEQFICIEETEGSEEPPRKKKKKKHTKNENDDVII